uniref:Uncharacterized protein n=1 Tax=Meloidogyne incognita TaxID=6306 RepID=A0A914LNH9_MELIC
MASFDEFNSSADYHSSWTEMDYCGCSSNNYYAVAIVWSTHCMGEFLRGVWDGVREFMEDVTFGFSAKFNGGLKEYSHDAILIVIKCKNCDRNMLLTCDLGRNGKEKRWGYYDMYLDMRFKRILKPSLPYSKLVQVFNGMWEKYGLINWNCSHWAGEFFEKVINLCDSTEELILPE